jgi:ribonuclease HII
LNTSTDSLPLFPDSESPSEADPLFHEKLLRTAGHGLVAGVDEAGRGPLAGPVVAAAVILSDGPLIEGIRDSKKMTAKAREAAFDAINRQATAVSVGIVSPAYIDQFNILQATLQAMRQAVLTLGPQPDYLLVDGTHTIPVPLRQRCLKRGDQISRSISAASIIAKVYRDRIMRSYDERYPRYGFRCHKGYGTKRHLAAIRTHGPCPIHRLTFRGVAADD